MTINDVGKKYGMDFSQGYADQRAANDANRERNVYSDRLRKNDSSHTVTNERIKNNYDSSANALDNNYFKQFQNTAQSNANRGLNAGIAANSALQLGMHKQDDVADLWKQRNTNQQEEDMRYANEGTAISEGMDQVEKEKANAAKQYFQDGLAQGYNILNGDRQAASQWAAQNYGMVGDQVANNNTYAGWDMNNNTDSANMYLSNLSDYTKMNVNDIYDQQDRQERAADRAAARAAARASSRGGGGGGGSYVPPSAKGPYSDFQKAKTPAGKSTSTPYDQYAQSRINNPGYKAVANSPRKSVHAAFGSPVKLADDPNLTAWQKMKIMGL
jgi:hypothetical protein